MPITRKQFEWETDSELIGTEVWKWMGKISRFLSEHKDEAFSASELLKALPIAHEDEAWMGGVWDSALYTLVETQTVEKKTIRAIEYYAFRE